MLLTPNGGTRSAVPRATGQPEGCQMDAAEQYVSTLDICEVCGRIVNKRALSECADPDCGLRFCIKCDCPCPVLDAELQ